MAEPTRDQGERRYWLDDPRNVTRIVWALVAICAALLLADAFYDKHGVFAIEHVFAFYALFGFVAYVGLIFLGKGLRTILMRPEDYYDRRDERGRDAGPRPD